MLGGSVGDQNLIVVVVSVSKAADGLAFEHTVGFEWHCDGSFIRSQLERHHFIAICRLFLADVDGAIEGLEENFRTSAVDGS